MGVRLGLRLGLGFEVAASPAVLEAALLLEQEERELGQALDRARERRAACLVEGETVDVLLE